MEVEVPARVRTENGDQKKEENQKLARGVGGRTKRRRYKRRRVSGIKNKRGHARAATIRCQPRPVPRRQGLFRA